MQCAPFSDANLLTSMPIFPVLSLNIYFNKKCHFELMFQEYIIIFPQDIAAEDDPRVDNIARRPRNWKRN